MSTQDRKLREKEQRKNAIIHAAEKIFNKKGYEKTTIDDIAKQAELAKGTIYLYFKSKEEIFGGIILRGLENMTALLQEHQQKSLSGLQEFELAGKTFQEYCKKFSNYLKILALYQSQHFSHFIEERGTIVKKIESQKKEIVTILSKSLQRGIQDGSIDTSVDAQKTAMLTVITAASFTHPHNTHKHTDDCEIDMQEMIKYFFEVIVKAIKAK